MNQKAINWILEGEVMFVLCYVVNWRECAKMNNKKKEINFFRDTKVPKRDPQKRSPKEIPKRDPQKRSPKEIPKRDPQKRSPWDPHEIPMRSPWNPQKRSPKEIPKRDPQKRSPRDPHEIPKRSPKEIPKRSQRNTFSIISFEIHQKSHIPISYSFPV